MDREFILAALRAHEQELQSSGILHLDLFGSKARGDDTPQSDVDLIADFDPALKLSIIGKVHLQNRLTDILGLEVDLSNRRTLWPEVLERARQESILVF